MDGKHYRVEWAIDVFASSPRDAAQQALDIHRDPLSIATCFQVIEFDGDGSTTTVDLLEEPA